MFLLLAVTGILLLIGIGTLQYIEESDSEKPVKKRHDPVQRESALLPTPHVVGGYHRADDPDQGKVLDYLEQAIKPGQKVALEYQGTPEKLLDERWPAYTQDHKFWRSVAQLAARKGATVETVEDIDRYELQSTMIGREDLTKEQKEAKSLDLTLERTDTFMQQARKKNADIVIMGIKHAYQLKREGYTDVTLISDIPQEDKADLERALDRRSK